MKPIHWDPAKNQQLIAERGVSFKDVVFYLQRDEYPNQRVFVINIDGYVHR